MIRFFGIISEAGLDRGGPASSSENRDVHEGKVRCNGTRYEFTCFRAVFKSNESGLLVRIGSFPKNLKELGEVLAETQKELKGKWNPDHEFAVSPNAVLWLHHSDVKSCGIKSERELFPDEREQLALDWAFERIVACSRVTQASGWNVSDTVSRIQQGRSPESGQLALLGMLEGGTSVAPPDSCSRIRHDFFHTVGFIEFDLKIGSAKSMERVDSRRKQAADAIEKLLTQLSEARGEMAALEPLRQSLQALRDVLWSVGAGEARPRWVEECRKRFDDVRSAFDGLTARESPGEHT